MPRVRISTAGAVASALSALAAGCGGEAIDPLVACGVNRSCPAGFICASDNTCWKPPVPHAPGAPTNVNARRTLQGVAVSWDAVPGATAYVVVRATIPRGVLTFPGTPDTSFVDTSAVRTERYSYNVAGIGPGGAGPTSHTVFVDALPPAPPPPSSVGMFPGARFITVSWTRTGDTAVFRSTTTGGPYTQIAFVPVGSPGFFRDSALPDATTYFYVLQSFASDGFPGGRSPEVSGKTAVPPPSNLTVQAVPSSTRFIVSWDPVPGADGYCVKLFQLTCSFLTTTATTYDTGELGPQLVIDIRVTAVTFIPNAGGLVLESVDAGPIRVSTQVPPGSPVTVQ